MLPVSAAPDQLRRNRGLFHPTWSGIGGEASEWSGSGGGVWLSWELVNADDDCPRGCHLERPSAGAASFVLSTATTLSRVCGQQMRQNVVAVQAAPTSHTFRRICGEQTRESVWSVNPGPVELPKPKPWQMAVAPGNRCPRHAEPAVRCAEPLASQRFCMARGGIRPCRASSLANYRVCCGRIGVHRVASLLSVTKPQVGDARLRRLLSSSPMNCSKLDSFAIEARPRRRWGRVWPGTRAPSPARDPPTRCSGPWSGARGTRCARVASPARRP